MDKLKCRHVWDGDCTGTTCKKCGLKMTLPAWHKKYDKPKATAKTKE